MNRSSGLRNKLIYASIFIVMLIPLYLLGQPATGRSGDRAGQLAQMRADLNLAEANLGEIDPASESMKLASLGLRGVAATLLWSKAEDYRILQEWDRLSATLNQIANLQPHYEKVWEHQAHNLSYNVSVEFDDYRQRYDWVKKGMDFLTEGVHKNRLAPRLVWYTGWFYGQKLGMSDEKTQFRELFRNDEPFHERIAEEGIAVDSAEARGPDGRPDNWLVGRLWLLRGYDLVEGGVPLVDKSPITFYESGPKWRIEHAAAIEAEGIIDDRAKDAWERAADDWYGYGMRPIVSTRGFTVKLAGLDELHERRVEAVERFEEVAADAVNEYRQQRRAELTDAEREALEIPDDERTPDQRGLAHGAQQKLEPPYAVIARRLPEADQLKAIQIAAEIGDIDERLRITRMYRDQMNYPYWELRARAEQDDLMIEARRLIYQAQQRYQESDLDGEIALYEMAFEKWAEVLDRYPGLSVDASSDELIDAIKRYQVATDQTELPRDFPLRALWEMHEVDEGVATVDDYKRRRAEEEKAASQPQIDILKPFTGTAPSPAAATVEPSVESAAEATETPEEPTADAAPEATNADEASAEESSAEESSAEESSAEEPSAEEPSAEESSTEESSDEETGADEADTAEQPAE